MRSYPSIFENLTYKKSQFSQYSHADLSLKINKLVSSIIFSDLFFPGEVQILILFLCLSSNNNSTFQSINMALAARFCRKAGSLRNCVMIQSCSLKQTSNAKLLCHGCYFEVDHRTDNKFVLCKVNPAHKQQQKNNIDFRLRQKYYKWGLRDLGANQEYIDSRLYDLGYNCRDQVLKLKNNHKFDGLKDISKKATELSSEKSKQLD